MYGFVWWVVWARLLTGESGTGGLWHPGHTGASNSRTNPAGSIDPLPSCEIGLPLGRVGCKQKTGLFWGIGICDRGGLANPNSAWAWWADRLESQGRAAVPDQRLSSGRVPSCSEEVFVLLRASTVFFFFEATHIIECSLLYPESTNLNVNIIQKTHP